MVIAVEQSEHDFFQDNEGQIEAALLVDGLESPELATQEPIEHVIFAAPETNGHVYIDMPFGKILDTKPDDNKRREDLVREAALIERIKSMLFSFGETHEDRKVVGEFFTLCQKKLAKYFGHRVRPDEVDDLTQDVLEKLVRGLPGYQKRENPFDSWMYRMAHNHLIDTIRRDKGRREVLLDDGAYQKADTGAEDAFLAVEKSEAQEKARSRLETALSGLKKEQEMAIRLRYFDGFTHEEAGKIIGTSEDASKKLVSRGLDIMRKRYVEER